MSYIWHNPDWHNLFYDKEEVSKAYERYIEKKAQANEVFSPLDERNLDGIKVQNLANGAVSSLAIEEEQISFDSIYSSIARKLNIKIANDNSNAYSDSISDIAVDAILNKTPLEEKRIKLWHKKLFENLAGIKPRRIGEYRNGPVYICHKGSKNDDPIYEGVPADSIDKEMKFLISYIRDSKHRGIIKSSIASLLFILIHPFEDGNGRISRTISDYIIESDQCDSPVFYSFSSAILEKRAEYYNEIARISTQSESLDITSWIIWNIDIAIRSIDIAINSFYMTIRTSMLISSLDPSVYNSREIAMLYKLASGSFYGKLTSSKWARMTKCSQAAAVRDIRHLVNEGFLIPSKEKGSEQGYHFNSDTL